jgi:Na+/melibiose symporter-like transporter
MTAPAALSRRTVAGYAIGSVGTGGFSTLPGLLLAYYLTDVLGVAALAASLVVLLPKAWDVVIDPFVGNLSDASAHRRGDRRLLMLVGGSTLPVFFALTFAVPAGAGEWLGASWVVVAFVLAATAFSCFQVPYIALPAEITHDYGTRTRLLSWRIAALSIAILLFGAGGPAVRDAAGGGHRGYLVMGIVAGAAIGAGMLWCWWWTPRRGEVTVTAHEPATLRRQIADARENGPFVVLLTVFVLQALATGAMLAAAQYVATYVLGNESAISLLFAGLVAPAIIVMPVWQRVADGVGTERGLALASSLFLVATLLLVLLRASPGAWVYVVVGLAGVAYAGMQAFPLAMLPDTVTVQTARTGRGRPGSLAGLWTAAETAGLACGPALVLVVLGLSGFISSRSDETVVQPAGAITGIVLAFSLLPAALVLVSLAVLRRYGLRRADVEAAAAQLAGDGPR